ncbi:MAG: hypothetical protein A4E28_02237 [Methanocella sp. PtaU1.Bin125]|nr:MAG: hypothetical protein A4E28_02237 [Methanocella sp. PtaU1.Bin125]
MFERRGLIILVLVAAVLAAGCTSGPAGAPATPGPEKQAALNATLEKAALVSSLESAYAKIGSDIAAASFTPPPQLNKSMVEADIATVDSYMAALADYRTASAGYRAFLDNGSAEYRQAADNETGAETKRQEAAGLKQDLGLVSDWLAEYDIWKPVNDTAGERIKEMLYFATLTDPYHQSSPAEGIRFFDQARPQFIAYLNESAVMIDRTDALIGALDNSTARNSLVRFKADIESTNGWVKTNYNLMVDAFNDKTKGHFGVQERIG